MDSYFELMATTRLESKNHFLTQLIQAPSNTSLHIARSRITWLSWATMQTCLSEIDLVVKPSLAITIGILPWVQPIHKSWLLSGGPCSVVIVVIVIIVITSSSGASPSSTG